MVSLNEKRSKIRYAIQNKSEWVDGKVLLRSFLPLTFLFFRLDTSKFGKKMLEKMGWTTGVGLGKNEDGNVEHIDLKFKSNLKGVGYVQGKYDSTWIGHSLSFDNVLQQLQQSHSTPNNEKNKSSVLNFHENVQQTKTRFTFVDCLFSVNLSLSLSLSFRYKKQSSGKDLSSRSANELECIFGKSSPDSAKIEEEEEEEAADNLYTTSKQSISDYFREKSRQKRKVEEVFEGSNLSELEGYSGWKIETTLEEICRRKEKQRKKKLRSK